MRDWGGIQSRANDNQIHNHIQACFVWAPVYDPSSWITPNPAGELQLWTWDLPHAP